MPPPATTVADPVLPPLQSASLGVAEEVSSAGSAIVTDAREVHPFASVTVTS